MSQEQFTKDRADYPVFAYRGFRAELAGDGVRGAQAGCAGNPPGRSVLQVTYDFAIPGLAEFHPRWEFPLAAESAGDGASAGGWVLPASGDPLDDPVLRRLLFSLGMVETISYYKAVCPPTLRIFGGSLSGWQQGWWRKLYHNGLGEFFYRNGIEVSEEELVRFECAGGDLEQEAAPDASRRDALDREGIGTDARGSDAAPEDTPAGTPLHDARAYSGVLVPVGGGKDSVVSLELLRGEDITTYVVNGSDTTRNVIALCDHKKGEYTARRVLDKGILELNERGFLNGHIPFSAVVAFSAVTAAYLCGLSDIALSNETSANETTVPGSYVNHQYSKSYEFERDFQTYFQTLTDSRIHYFSLLRPLTELQIAAVFAKQVTYHRAFRSCNRGSREGIWCCSCPKCLFVNIILSPFLGEDALRDIFGEKLLDKESLERDFRELCGLEENKPFECVGTRREVNACLADYLAKGRHSLLTDRYADYIRQKSHPGEVEELLSEWCGENAVPERYLEKVSAWMRELTEDGGQGNDEYL